MMKKREASWYAENKLQPSDDFFEWCLSFLPVYKWSNKQKTICSSERVSQRMVEKRLTKVSRLDFNGGFYPFTIVLVNDNRIEIQTYGYWQNIINGKESIETQMINMEILAKNEHIEIGYYWYRQEWCYGLTSIGVQGGKYTGTKLYENDWKEKVLKKSELKYLDFSFEDELVYTWLPHYYRMKTEIEYLQKIKANTIATQVAKNYGIDYRTLNQNWLRKNKQLLKNNSDDFFTFELKRRIRERGGKVVPGIEGFLNYRDLSIISTKVGIISFQNWVIKNQVNMQYYRDYLSLLKDLEIKVDNRNLIMPKDLEVAHDNAVGLLNSLEREIDNKKMAKRAKALAKLEKTIGEYVFVAPKDLNELVVEGKQLHHCVGSSSYVEAHRNGETTIVFVRRAKCPNTPFYTMEFKNKKIIQLRGKHNASAPVKVKQVVDQWLEIVNNKAS